MIRRSGADEGIEDGVKTGDLLIDGTICRFSLHRFGHWYRDEDPYICDDSPGNVRRLFGMQGPLTFWLKVEE